MPQDLQKVFNNGIKEYEKNYVKLYFDYDNSCLDIMRKAGVKINELTDKQHQAFKDKSAPIYSDYKDVIGEDLVNLAISSSK